jgi:hypothetical protein
VSAKKQKKMTRQAIIVLGMHRTGTSAISGVLAKLGVQAPKSLMPPTPDNPRGYWESTAIMKFNDRILKSAGTQWSDWDKFNAEWVNTPLHDGFMDELSSLLADEYGDDPLILIKDPRMCRLFPFWAAAFHALEITPKILIPLRHPSEVIKSLEVRDHLAGNQSKLIWLRHMLDAEYSSRGLCRTFVRYSDVLRDWQLEFAKVSDGLDIKWPRASAATTAEIDAYLAPELRHHVATEAALNEGHGIASWVSTTYRAIGSLVDGTMQAEAMQALDRVRDEFDRTSAVYAPVVHEQRSKFEQEIDGLKEGIATISGEKDALDHAHVALKQENLANYNLYDDARKMLSEAERHGQEREATFVALVSKYEVTRAEMTAQLKSRDDACTEMESRHKAAQAELTTRLEHQASAYNEMQISLAAKLDYLEAARTELEAGHHAELVAMATRLNAEIAKLREAARLAEESVLERSNETAELTKWVLGLEERLGAQEASAREEREAANRTISAGNKKNRSLQVAIDESHSRNRALELELDAQRKLISAYHEDMERIRSGKYWRIATALGKMRRAGRQPPPEEKGGKSDADVLRGSSLFDGDWYLKRYPDVRSSGMDPIEHYLKHGTREGRDPCAAFSTREYMARYPDVGLAGANPLAHYIKHGRQEGRVISKKDAGTNDAH